ncbi:ATP-binding protein [Paenibacillus humicola]|uniref:ATP-binding protein n=1 Tax=Paenibacillus humicola TaxID=3110540 RepID=UPI00237B7101|nr:ATP-binding protein [Paenibacillus humicola]
MWEHLLLQIIIALLPTFLFQLWHDRSIKPAASRARIGLLFGASVFLSSSLLSSVDGFNLSFCLVPLIIGSLYGGGKVMGALFTVIILAKTVLFHNWWELSQSFTKLAAVLPFLLVFSRRYTASSRRDKHLSLLAITTSMMISHAALLIGYWLTVHPPLSDMDVCFMAVHMLLYYLTTWVSVFLIENFYEKQAISGELLRMSDNYRIEAQKLQQFIEETPLGVLLVDERGRITHINDMAVRLFPNYRPQNGRASLIGRTYDILFGGADGGILTGVLERALSGQKTESELAEQQGKMILKSAIGIRDAESGRMAGAAVILHDITEITRLRAELGRIERLSLVGQMAASITHEIRNPMAVIRGFVQLLRERSPEGQDEYFRIVMDELDRANSIITDFLSLAQNRVIEKMSCSIHGIISEILPLIWADANLRGQSVELELSDDMPPLELNGKEIKQLILNLARNGMEAMEQKGVLRISTAVSEDFAELRVADTGSGIPKEKLNRLFEPFFTTKTGGTGLGLPLCLSIVERHGGHIAVESEEGKGTTFIVRFLRRAAEQEAAAALE